MASTLLADLGSAVHEYFFLTQAERASAALSASEHARLADYRAAGMRRLAGARELRDPPNTTAALLLYREAASCLVAARRLTGRPDREELSPNELLACLRQELGESDETAGDRLTCLAEALGRQGPLALDRLSPVQGQLVADAFEWSVAGLLASLKARSPDQLTRLRLVRRVVPAAAILGGLLLFSLWALSPQNLSKGRPVRASAAAYGTAAAGAVDGETSGRFGYHSVEEENPWLVVDLQRRASISRVRVLGRSDCCFEQSVPLDLEISDDGASFRTAAKRAEGFSQADPWVVTPRSTSARYIRLRVEKRAVLVLTELEVYGRPER